MIILLACEGHSEVYLIESLMENGSLSFEYPLMLDKPCKIRQLSEIAPIIHSLPINEDIIVYRIGDTLKDELSKTGFEIREKHIKEYKVYTKLEIEVSVKIIFMH
ncbi:MAG: hypothetical protein ACI31G_01025 [Bacilli bacterium]